MTPRLTVDTSVRRQEFRSVLVAPPAGCGKTSDRTCAGAQADEASPQMQRALITLLCYRDFTDAEVLTYTEALEDARMKPL